MKAIKFFSCITLAASFLFLSVASSNAEVIFMDDFSSGDLSKVQGSARWGGTRDVTVVNQSARFKFTGTSNPSGHAFSELRFDLGRLYPEVWVQFRLFIPANYKHRYPNSAASNNKFIRLWPQNYDDLEKVGYSTWRSGSDYSSLRADWNIGTGIGPKGDNVANFITDADKGRWMTIRIHAKAASSSSQHGTLRFWKNGTLIINNSNTVNNYRTGGLNAFRYGYLLGWANSGFDEDTYLSIDNVVFATSSSDLDGGSSSQPDPPPPTSLSSPNNLMIVSQ